MSHSESGIIDGLNGQSRIDASADYVNREIISVSANSVITKAQKGGRLWILKSIPKDSDNYLMRLDILRKEYDIMCQLNHPSVVQAIEMIDDESLGPAIVMEYVDGRSLSDYSFQSSKDRMRLVHLILDAVAYIHSKQIVHRDLKPDNILVTHNGHNIKIIDFGFADTDSHTTLKQPAGTMNYISPEQMQTAVADVRNDVYSLGVNFREMKLSWRYGHILKRMSASLDSRYTSVSEVQNAFTHTSRLWRIAVGVMIILLIISMGAFTLINDFSQQEKIRTQEMKIALQDSMIRQQVQSIQHQTAEIDSQSRMIGTQSKQIESQSAQIQSQTAQIDELSIVKAEQARLDSLFVQGKKRVDAYLTKVGFKRHTMNVPVKDVDAVKLTEWHNHTLEIIKQFVEIQKLEARKAYQLNTLLEEYYIQTYWQPWYKRNSQYNGKK